MSQDTIDPARPKAVTIYAGATFRKGWTRLIGEGRTPDDYTDCTAIAELRDASSNALLTTFSSATGGIDLLQGEGRLGLYLSADATKALTPFESAVAHIELRRPWGDVERLYEIAFAYSAEKTQADPPTP